jgi:hypothetical protein
MRKVARVDTEKKDGTARAILELRVPTLLYSSDFLAFSSKKIYYRYLIYIYYISYVDLGNAVIFPGDDKSYKIQINGTTLTLLHVQFPSVV